MLKKTALGLVFIVAIFIGAFLLISKINAPSSLLEIGTNNQDNSAVTEEVSVTWIEILAGTASLRQADGTLFELKTGDEIPGGSVVVTDEKGLAIIHLPDGSSVQLDVSSEARFDQAEYDNGSDTLRVKVALTAGRIWSKIIELTTPESYWEVKTTNAVAAVRGTAFGMEYAEGETQIIGSENTVEVQPIDPVSGEIITENIAKVTANKILAIKRDAVIGLKERRINLSKEVRDIAPELLERPWVKRAILRDRIINQKVEKWLQEGMTKIEARRALRHELMDDRRLLLRQLLNWVQQNVSNTVNLQSSDFAAAVTSGEKTDSNTTTLLKEPVILQPLKIPLNSVGTTNPTTTTSSSPIAPVTNYVQ